jgi:hypothetical protein
MQVRRWPRTLRREGFDVARHSQWCWSIMARCAFSAGSLVLSLLVLYWMTPVGRFRSRQKLGRRRLRAPLSSLEASTPSYPARFPLGEDPAFCGPAMTAPLA